jgi:hypothetical protein
MIKAGLKATGNLIALLKIFQKSLFKKRDLVFQLNVSLNPLMQLSGFLEFLLRLCIQLIGLLETFTAF